MMEFIPVNEPIIGDQEKELVLSCLNTGWISSEGSFVEEFESKFSYKCARKYGIAVSSGTAALDIAIQALNISKDDEIIMPSFTIISCIHQIVRIGAIPVFVDSDLRTWNMDISKVEDNITSKTKAILVPHIYGLAVDMQFILDLAKKYNLLVIEDAAEVIGQECRTKPCGSFGDISIFSFYANKHITTGEGGMIVTNSENLNERCKALRNLCFQNENRFIHEEIGWNYRMTNIQAALGLGQLSRLEKIIHRKKEIGLIYTEKLKELSDFILLPDLSTEYSSNIFWVFGIILKNQEKFKSAKNLSIFLKENNIGNRPFFYPLHLQPVLLRIYPHLGNIKLPISEKMYKNGLYLPSGLALTNDQIDYVCSILKKAFQDF